MGIDKQFLEKVLKEPILDFEESAGSKAGDNVAGSLLSVKVNTESGKTVNLVYKYVPNIPDMQAYASRCCIFLIEVTMYDQVGPEIEKMAKSRGSKNPYRVPMPKYYSGNHDTNAVANHYLCLEDVRPLGYVMPDKFKGLSLPEVTLVLKELAKLHASSYCWIKYEGENLFDRNEGINTIRESPVTRQDPEFGEAGTKWISNEMKNAVKIIRTQNLNELADKVEKKLVEPGFQAGYNLFKSTQLLTDVEAFPCIIHGDIWANNIMIKYDDKGNPIDLKFIDFQLSRRGNIYEDLGYFIMTSTTPKFRKEHLLQVLGVYFDSFADALEELKCPMPLGFTKGRFIDTFYERRLAFFAYMCFAIPMQLAEPFDFSSVPKANGNANDAEGKGPKPADEPKLTPLEKMMQGFEMRSQLFFAQMMKSPKAIARLVDIAQEMVDMKVI